MRFRCENSIFKRKRISGPVDSSSVYFSLSLVTYDRLVVFFLRGLKEFRSETDEKVMISVCLSNHSATKNKLALFTEQ